MDKGINSICTKDNQRFVLNKSPVMISWNVFKMIYIFSINDSKIIEKSYEQFHLLLQWFQKSSVAEAHEGYILVCGKWFKP